MPCNFTIRARLAAICCLSLLIGCSAEAVTVDVSPIRKDSTGQITAEADKASMTSDRSGAAVTSDRTTVTLVEIGEGSVQVDVTHPDYEPQRAEIALGSEKDVFPGDVAEGVRVRASRYQP